MIFPPSRSSTTFSLTVFPHPGLSRQCVQVGLFACLEVVPAFRVSREFSHRCKRTQRGRRRLFGRVTQFFFEPSVPGGNLSAGVALEQLRSTQLNSWCPRGFIRRSRSSNKQLSQLCHATLRSPVRFKVSFSRSCCPFNCPRVLGVPLSFLPLLPLCLPLLK